MHTPDENALRGIDDTEAQIFEHGEDIGTNLCHESNPISEDKEIQSKWRRDEDVVDITSIRRPLGPDSSAMEACTSFAVNNSHSTSRPGKRSLSELDDASNSQRRAQRLKTGINFARSEEENIFVKSFQSVEETDVFLQGPSLASDAQSLVIIAHSDHHQKFFNKHKISWGVQWEIARLVSSRKLEYGEILMDDLKKLCGPSTVAAPLVEKLFRKQKGNIRYRRTYEEAFERELSTRVRLTRSVRIFWP